MNLDICRKCRYFPDHYEMARRNKTEIIFHGIQKLDDSSKFTSCIISCIISYKGNKMDGYIADKFVGHKISISIFETFLKNKKVKPMKKLCPYYMEHQLIEWNEKK